MLPSFRLIAATFLCGFLVVFAGLRLATSLNDIHAGLPVLAAHAAPAAIPPAADREMRRGLAAAPVMYDLRFAVSTGTPTLVRVAPTVLDQLPLGQLMSLLPPEATSPDVAADAGSDNEAAQLESAFAALQPREPDAEADIVSDAPAEPPQPQAPVVAVIDTRADWQPDRADAPAAARSASEIPAPAAKAAAIEPQTAALPEADAEPLLAEPGAAAIQPPANVPAASGDVPDAPSAVAIPRRQPAISAPRAKAKAAIVHKKRIRTARRMVPANASGGFGHPPGTPFGNSQ